MDGASHVLSIPLLARWKHQGTRYPLEQGLTHSNIGFSNIGFQLTQFPGKMAMERKGGRVSALGMLNKVFLHDCSWTTVEIGSSARERFGGVSRKPPWSKPRKIRVTAWSTVWNRYTVGRPPLHQHLLASSSLDGKCQWCPVPLRGNCTMKIQCPWIWGLTHTVCRESALLERGLAVNSLLAGWLACFLACLATGLQCGKWVKWGGM